MACSCVCNPRRTHRLEFRMCNTWAYAFCLLSSVLVSWADNSYYYFFFSCVKPLAEAEPLGLLLHTPRHTLHTNAWEGYTCIRLPTRMCSVKEGESQTLCEGWQHFLSSLATLFPVGHRGKLWSLSLPAIWPCRAPQRANPRQLARWHILMVTQCRSSC